MKERSSLVSGVGEGASDRISRSAAEGESVLRCVMKAVSVWMEIRTSDVIYGETLGDKGIAYNRQSHYPLVGLS